MIKVSLKFLRHSPRKLRATISHYRGKNLDDALRLSSLSNDDSTYYTNKILKMAASAAKDKEYRSGDLVIKEIFATDGPKIKRIRANARGRTNAYRKHLAHLTVILKEKEKKQESRLEKSDFIKEENKDGSEN